MLKLIRCILLLTLLVAPVAAYAAFSDLLPSRKQDESTTDPKAKDTKKDDKQGAKPVEKKEESTEKVLPDAKPEDNADSTDNADSADNIDVEPLPEKDAKKSDKEKAADAKKAREEEEAAKKKAANEIPPPVIKVNEDEDQLACKTTPTIGPAEKNMKAIKKSSNMVRKAGSPRRAGGDYIQITGMVLDENCLPIQGAVVGIWQTDSSGHYEWEYDSTRHFEIPLSGKDNNFLYSGSAQTDNRGQYSLYTILPGSVGESAPYINIIVKRVGYKTLYTRMYFAAHPRNDSDPIITGSSAPIRERIIATGNSINQEGQNVGRMYFFPITMRGIGSYKRF